MKQSNDIAMKKKATVEKKAGFVKPSYALAGSEEYAAKAPAVGMSVVAKEHQNPPNREKTMAGNVCPGRLSISNHEPGCLLQAYQ